MERVIEIVNYVMKQIIFEGKHFDSEVDLMASLVELGYSEEEISVAFKLLHTIPYDLNSDKGFNIIDNDSTSHRVLSPGEQKKLTFSCQEEILRLKNNSLLNNEEFEKVLVEAILFESQNIGLKELEMILHKVVHDEERLLMILAQLGRYGNNNLFFN